MKITSYLDIFIKLGYTPPAWASLTAGALVLVTLTLSVYLLLEHLSAYKNPEVVLCCCHIVFGCRHIVNVCSYWIIILFYFLFGSTLRNKNS